MGDDFHFALWLMEHGVSVYFHENGVWRILGHELGNAATLANPMLPGIVSISTHWIATLLFFAVLRQLLDSEPLALLLALVFGVFPWGDTALMWACEFTYLLSTTLFLAVLCLLFRAFPLKASVAAPLCVLCAALSLFAHECLFFALVISGAVVFLRKDGFSARERLPMAMAPLIGCGIWWTLYKIFPGRIPPEHIKIQPRTLLSGVYYQYTDVWIFEPWKSPGTRGLLFFDWAPWQFAVGLVMVGAVVLFVHRAIAPSRGGAPRHPKANYGMFIFLILLVVAAVAIYALGGGFSLDSRKKYPVIPVLLMAVGYGLDRFMPRLLPRGRAFTTTALVMVLCGISTTWLHIGLWRYEAKRLDLLADFLSTQPDANNVTVEWDSRIQAAWPRSTQYWGAPVEQFVVRNAVELKRRLSPPAEYAAPVKAVKFDADRFQWEPAD